MNAAPDQIRLRIGAIRMEGMQAIDRALFQSAFETTLTRLISSQPPVRPAALERIPFQLVLPPNPSSQTVAERLARAVHQRLIQE